MFLCSSCSDIRVDSRKKMDIKSVSSDVLNEMKAKDKTRRR
eukprot:UN13167